MEAYRKREWTCSKTGRSELTFEEVMSQCLMMFVCFPRWWHWSGMAVTFQCLLSEKAVNDKIAAFPELFKKYVLSVLHFK